MKSEGELARGALRWTEVWKERETGRQVGKFKVSKTYTQTDRQIDVGKLP